LPAGAGRISGTAVSVKVPSNATFNTCSEESVGELESAYKNAPVGSSLRFVAPLLEEVAVRVRCCSCTGA